MKRLLVFLLLTAATVASAQQIASYVQNAYTVGPLTNGNAACLSGTSGGLADCGGAPIAVPVSIANGGSGSTSARAAATALSTVYVLCNSGASTTTASTTEVKLLSCDVPANALGANGYIEVDFMVSTVTTTQTATIITRVQASAGGGTGGTALMSDSLATNLNVAAKQKVRNANATGSQIANRNLAGSFSQTSTAFPTASIDTTAIWSFSLNGKIASGNGTTDIVAIKDFTVKIVSSAGN